MNSHITFNQTPYQSLIWDKFLPPTILNIANKEFNNLNENDFLTHPTGYKFAPCKEIEVLKFLYSQNLKNKIQSYFNRKIKRSKSYPFPQYYEFPKNYNGLPPHTDADEDRDLAMIIYLNTEWNKNDGGELVIMSSEYSIVSEVEPTLNKMVCLHLNKNAWHAVNKSGDHFKRKTLIIDWDFEE